MEKEPGRGNKNGPWLMALGRRKGQVHVPVCMGDDFGGHEEWNPPKMGGELTPTFPRPIFPCAPPRRTPFIFSPPFFLMSYIYIKFGYNKLH